jgi:hypothetical protein
MGVGGVVGRGRKMLRYVLFSSMFSMKSLFVNFYFTAPSDNI